MNASHLLLIGFGGFLGAILRFLLGSTVQSWLNPTQFPYGTLTVNLIGCFLMGFLAYLATTHGLLSQELKHLLLIGFLGSFTTYSTFGNDTLTLFQSNQTLFGFLYLGLHMLLGLGAVWLGQVLAIRLGNL